MCNPDASSSRQEAARANDSMQSDVHTETQSPADTPSPRLSAQKFTATRSVRDERWVEVRDGLIKLALDGDANVSRYGDMIADEAACTRFLRGTKGNVVKAVEMFQEHLEWRVRYKLDSIVDEDFSDLKEIHELYWSGRDKDGVITLMWRLRKHDSRRTDAKRFVRFFVHQIESGLRRSGDYPNGQFNIMVDLDKVGYANADQEMGIILQSVLSKNYPKVRKGLYVFPINWFVQLFWDTLLKPLLATLQPDIEDKICPLTGDWKAKLRDRYEICEIEVDLGGELDVSTRSEQPVLAYAPTPYTQLKSRVTDKARTVRDQVMGTADGEGQASDSEEEEEEEEFTTPVASPPSSHNSIFLPSAPLSLAPPTHLVEGRAQEAQVERPRAARVVGLMNEGMSSGMDEPPAGMQRSVSGIVLQSVLQSAHGGVWDAHGGAERAALMKSAMHSMKEAGVDEEVAQKVFELDRDAVARILTAAQARCSEDDSPREASLDDLIQVAQEYGLLSASSTPLSPATGEMSAMQQQQDCAAGTRDAQVVPANGQNIAAGGDGKQVDAGNEKQFSGGDGKQVDAGNEKQFQPQTPPWPLVGNDLRSFGEQASVGTKTVWTDVLITDDYLREHFDEPVSVGDGCKKPTAGRPQALVGGSMGKSQNDAGASPPLAVADEISHGQGSSKGDGPVGTGDKEAAGQQEEGIFDLVSSQLELLRLLQVVLR